MIHFSSEEKDLRKMLAKGRESFLTMIMCAFMGDFKALEVSKLRKL